VNVFICRVEGHNAVLTAEESWHCAKVLRYKAGQMVDLIDGKGNYFEGRLDFVMEKECRAHIIQGPRKQRERGYYLHLAIAPTKQIDRIEWMIEKAVEIGVDELSFVLCKNSERTVIKTERIQKIVESAVKQSLQAMIPKVNEAITLNKFIADRNEDQKLIAHCTELPKKDIRQVIFKGRKTVVIIGPEGDFTKEEIDVCTANKFEGISLGNNRLRTETAGLFVCQAASLLSS